MLATYLLWYLFFPVSVDSTIYLGNEIGIYNLPLHIQRIQRCKVYHATLIPWTQSQVFSLAIQELFTR